MTSRQANLEVGVGRETRAWIHAGAGMTRTVGFILLALAVGIVLLPLIATRAAAQERTLTYSVLYSFTGGVDGGFPNAGLIADAAGNLYGETGFGGNTSGSCPFGGSGCGIAFKIDPAGNETVLYSFSGGTDGGIPYGGLVRDGASNLYGTTAYGGNTSGSCIYGASGCGVIFKLDPAGNETVLYTFSGGADGSNPGAGLVRDPAGNLYGTTQYGGDSVDCFGGGGGCGVVFKLDRAGNETVLHTFAVGSGGLFPIGGLIRDAVGNLYGTTYEGGNDLNGVVFIVDPVGNETVLYTFTGAEDGGNPNGNLLRDSAGNLYGTAQGGGLGYGVVFRVDPSGNETVLHSFTGGADGRNPAAGLIQDAAGDLYGTTAFGGNTGNSCTNGSSGCGVVFKLDPAGQHYGVLYTFSGGADGASPYSGLLPYKGSLYGTTNMGGNTSACFVGCGVVFKLH